MSRVPTGKNHPSRGPSNRPLRRSYKAFPALEHRHRHAPHVQRLQTPPHGSRPPHSLAASHSNEGYLCNFGHRRFHSRPNSVLRHSRGDHDRQREPVLIRNLAATSQSLGHQSPLYNSLSSSIEWTRREIPSTPERVAECPCSRRTRKLVLGSPLHSTRDTDNAQTRYRRIPGRSGIRRGLGDPRGAASRKRARRIRRAGTKKTTLRQPKTRSLPNPTKANLCTSKAENQHSRGIAIRHSRIRTTRRCPTFTGNPLRGALSHHRPSPRCIPHRNPRGGGGKHQHRPTTSSCRSR